MRHIPLSPIPFAVCTRTLPARDPKRFRVFVVVSRQALIDSRFSTIICAPVYSTRHGLATQVDVGLNEGLRPHQTQVSRRCTDGCTGAAPQLERTSGWYSLGANPIRRQEPRCPDRCCDSQRIRCTHTALVFPVPRTGFPCSPQKIPCSTKQIPCFFPVKQGNRARDGFAPDCAHRHPLVSLILLRYSQFPPPICR